ncbi:helix-turn-helix domain-containing protein [Paraburkholderia sacchari]|uniref:helix-turn-helix domain-containing protein n=1 Tax=Paraburkholderia sacchari TaxID=159450 RepID=UPI003D98D379
MSTTLNETVVAGPSGRANPSSTGRHILYPPRLGEFPGDVYVRHENFGADSQSPPHQHPWGQINYVSYGVEHLIINGQHFLSPPEYAVWIPPNAQHSSFNTAPLVYRSLYLSNRVSATMPCEPCSLWVGPIFRAILADFALRNVASAKTREDRRLMHVLLDQIRRAPVCKTYLPCASTPLMETILSQLQRDPGDDRTVSDWAKEYNVTERTLTRMCQRELGMPLGEWRQRLRFLRALRALETRQDVKEIAFDLGYSNPSAFIVMFRKLSGKTPQQYRSELLNVE